MDAAGGQVPVRGSIIGRFLVLETLGQGGMGVVLAAYDPELDRRVALKLLRHARPAGCAEEGDRCRASLLREAQAMARLAHPNVVTVFDVGTVGEQDYVAMEFVEGETLRAWLAREPRSWQQIVEVFLAAGRGLAAAHAAGLVHRDFKPDNVLVGKDGRVRVSDFGLASASSQRLEDADPRRREPIRASGLLRGLTVDGAVMGTPAYMASEQHEGGAVGPQADQFAFCVSLYEALYDERPFRADSYAALVAEVKEGRVREPARGAKMPARLRAVVMRGLAADPGQRHPDMGALLKALAHHPRAVRRRAATAAAATVAVLAAWVLLVRPAANPVCTGARERLAGVWDPAVRAGIERAFRGTHLAYAQESFDRVAGRLSRHAEAWVAMHTDSCRATRVRGEQSAELLDLRTVCLEKRRSEMSALTSALQTADSTTLSTAVVAAAELPPIDECADLAALRAQVPPPRDPATARKVKALEDRVTQLATLNRLGKATELFAEAKRLATEADTIGYGPLRAHTHHLLGKYFIMAHDIAAAEKALLRMSRAAAEGRDDKRLVSAFAQLAMIYEMKGASAESLAMGRAAEVTARRTGDAQALTTALIIVTMSLQSLGQLDEAKAKYEEAIATVDTVAGREDQVALISPLMHLGSAAEVRGNYNLARSYLDRALAIARAALGPGHTRTLQLQRTISSIAAAQGRLDEALALATSSLEELRRQGRQNSIPASAFMVPTAHVARLLGDLPRAERLLTEARAIEDRIGRRGAGAMHPQTRAELRIDQGRYREARELLEVLLEPGTVQDSGRRAEVHILLGTVAQKRGRPAEARRHFEEALALRKRSSGTDHPGYGRALVALAGLHVAEGRCRRARPQLDQGQAILEKALDRDHYVMAEPLTLRARCDIEDGNAAAAVAPLARAVELREKVKLAPARRGQARALLARALWQMTDGDQARAAAEAATAERELLAGGLATAVELAELRLFGRRFLMAAARP
jgi:eukaryotic-like serine/threonine-protein kinase